MVGKIPKLLHTVSCFTCASMCSPSILFKSLIFLCPIFLVYPLSFLYWVYWEHFSLTFHLFFFFLQWYFSLCTFLYSLLSTYCIMFFNEVYISWNVFLPFLIPRTMFNLYGLLMLHFPFSSHSPRIPFLISLIFSLSMSFYKFASPSFFHLYRYLSLSVSRISLHFNQSLQKQHIGKLKNINVSGDQKTFNLPWNIF